jgi:2-oxoglutarate dehydrogenase E1 component
MTTAVACPHDKFAAGGNAHYVDEMYRNWREDPKSVHAPGMLISPGWREVSRVKTLQTSPGLMERPLCIYREVTN